MNTSPSALKEEVTNRSCPGSAGTSGMKPTKRLEPKNAMATEILGEYSIVPEKTETSNINDAAASTSESSVPARKRTLEESRKDLGAYSGIQCMSEADILRSTSKAPVDFVDSGDEDVEMKNENDDELSAPSSSKKNRSFSVINSVEATAIDGESSVPAEVDRLEPVAATDKEASVPVTVWTSEAIKNDPNGYYNFLCKNMTKRLTWSTPTFEYSNEELSDDGSDDELSGSAIKWSPEAIKNDPDGYYRYLRKDEDEDEATTTDLDEDSDEEPSRNIIITKAEIVDDSEAIKSAKMLVEAAGRESSISSEINKMKPLVATDEKTSGRKFEWTPEAIKKDPNGYFNYLCEDDVPFVNVYGLAAGEELPKEEKSEPIKQEEEPDEFEEFAKLEKEWDKIDIPLIAQCKALLGGYDLPPTSDRESPEDASNLEYGVKRDKDNGVNAAAPLPFKLHKNHIIPVISFAKNGDTEPSVLANKSTLQDNTDFSCKDDTVVIQSRVEVEPSKEMIIKQEIFDDLETEECAIKTLETTGEESSVHAKVNKVEPVWASNEEPFKEVTDPEAVCVNKSVVVTGGEFLDPVDANTAKSCVALNQASSVPERKIIITENIIDELQNDPNASSASLNQDAVNISGTRDTKEPPSESVTMIKEQPSIIEELEVVENATLVEELNQDENHSSLSSPLFRTSKQNISYILSSFWKDIWRVLRYFSILEYIMVLLGIFLTMYIAYSLLY